MQKQPQIERRISQDEKHVGVLRKDRFNITTPLDKTRNIKIKRKDAQARALSELGSIWQSLNDVKTPKMNVSKSL